MAIAITMHLLGLVAFLGHMVASASVESESACTATENSQIPKEGVGDSLLQVSSSHGSKVDKIGKAYGDLLPAHLHELGLETFGNEEALDKVITESETINIKYGGIPILLRIAGKDTAAQRFGGKDEDGSEYGLQTLLETRKGDHGMVNMVDMGGNYGVVSIAVYKKFPKLIRAVVVEPIASTYFFMRWNMWLNKVPSLTKEEFVESHEKPGVVALHRGVTDKEGKDLQMCSHPEWSMNARMMSQQSIIDGGECDCNQLHCTQVPGITAQSLFNDYFGDASINLLKMDCEGCEFESLPFLAEHASRVRRLVGELHLPEEHMIDTACQYDNGKYLTKVCRVAEWEWKSSLPLGCKEQRQACRWSR